MVARTILGPSVASGAPWVATLGTTHRFVIADGAAIPVMASWVWDWHADYDADGHVDPTGPAAGAFRVLRGGGWFSGAAGLRAANRNWGHPSNRNVPLGFRPARSVP